MNLEDVLDLQRFPIHQRGSDAYQALLARCKSELADNGMFNLPGFLLPQVAAKTVAQINPVMAEASFTHKRSHNIYFLDSVPGLAADHPALAHRETINHTLCADQLGHTLIDDIYRFPPLVRFLADCMDKSELHVMADELARVNVMSYRAGEALNWHFDRSEFTTTLLLQAPEGGGDFEYRTDLRSDDDPNYEGVAKMLRGEDPEVQLLKLSAGTLNVFRGKNTPHRVTPVEGETERMIAVFSYYEREGVMFSEQERIGFYGRAS